MNPVTGTGCTSADIGVNANLELVDKFCYLGDMLSVVAWKLSVHSYNIYNTKDGNTVRK